MGNRAVITTKDKRVGIYVHCNGGRDSVSAFLKYCELKGYRPPEADCYGWARLCQVIGNYFSGDGLGVGIDEYKHLDADNGDNGVYIIENWHIIGREFNHFEEQDNKNLYDMVEAINKCQPALEQICITRQLVELE